MNDPTSPQQKPQDQVELKISRNVLRGLRRLCEEVTDKFPELVPARLREVRPLSFKALVRSDFQTRRVDVL
jgi:hypothetical protein